MYVNVIHTQRDVFYSAAQGDDKNGPQMLNDSQNNDMVMYIYVLYMWGSSQLISFG